jgi:hypothetical protein
VAKTDKGGSCRIETITGRAGAAITYGGQVNDCTARFGVSSVVGRGLLFEDLNKLIVDATEAGSGDVPYERTKTFNGKANVPYRASWGVEVVIRTRKTSRRPRRPEHWLDPGPNCRVYTTQHAGDTLGCNIHQDF